jgi:hypothetical protein
LLCLDDRGPLSEREWELLDLYRLTDARGQETILRVAESQSAFGAAEAVDRAMTGTAER